MCIRDSVNTKQIYSIEKSFSGTSTVNFYQTHKQVHVSRHYYQLLKDVYKRQDDYWRYPNGSYIYYYYISYCLSARIGSGYSIGNRP